MCSRDFSQEIVTCIKLPILPLLYVTVKANRLKGRSIVDHYAKKPFQHIFQLDTTNSSRALSTAYCSKNIYQLSHIFLVFA